jgi:outer membrane protein TolC
VEVATLREREARAKVTQARGPLLPDLSGSASETNRTFNLRSLGFSFPAIPGAPPFPDKIGPVDDVEARLRVSETLIDPANWAKLGAAKTGVAVSAAERSGTADGAAQVTAIAYLRAARARAAVLARTSDIELAQALVTLAQAQVSAGTGAAIDLTRARTELASARGDQLIAQNQYDRALMDLARSLGLDASVRFTLTDTLSTELGRSTAPESPDAALLVEIAKQRHVGNERRRGARARADRRAIQAERLPKLEAQADYGLSGGNGPDAFPTRSLGVALTLPILDGFRREGRVSEQSAIVSEAEVRARELERQIAADVQGAFLDLHSALDQQRVATERLHLAEDEVEQARQRFENGVAGNIEVINAQASLVHARDADIDARFGAAAARVALARAAGVAQTVR